MRHIPFLILAFSMMSLHAGASLPPSDDKQAVPGNPVTNTASGVFQVTCTVCAINAARQAEKAGKGMFEEAAILPDNQADAPVSQGSKTTK